MWYWQLPQGVPDWPFALSLQPWFRTNKFLPVYSVFALAKAEPGCWRNRLPQPLASAISTAIISKIQNPKPKFIPDSLRDSTNLISVTLWVEMGTSFLLPDPYLPLGGTKHRAMGVTKDIWSALPHGVTNIHIWRFWNSCHSLRSHLPVVKGNIPAAW